MSEESRIKDAEHANKPERVGEFIALRKSGMLVTDIAGTVFPGVPDKVVRGTDHGQVAAQAAAHGGDAGRASAA